MGSGDYLLGYSIKLFRTPRFQGIQSTPVSYEGTEVLSNKVEGLLRKRVTVLTPRSGEEWVLQHLFPGALRPILNLKYFNLNVSIT